MACATFKVVMHSLVYSRVRMTVELHVYGSTIFTIEINTGR